MSKSNRVLVLGAHGLLGTHVVRAMEKFGAFELRKQSVERFTSSTDVTQYVSRVKPQTVVNCIGYKGTDAASHFHVNGCLPRALADWCHASGALLVHMSTNAVFDASEDRFWLPGDPLLPRTPYEVSKAYGEDPRAYVIRASFVGLSAERPGILADLLAGRPYWNRKWNGLTATALSRRMAAIVAGNHGTPVSRIEHVYSQTVIDMATVARLVGSASECLGDRQDARLLTGGEDLAPFETQIEEELATFRATRPD